MRSLILNEDIKPLSEFRANVSGFIKQVHKTKRPIVLTQHGKSAAVILDVVEYESIIDKLEVLQDIRIAETQLKNGDGVEHALAKKKILGKYLK
jgi:prevent-host-death family protein